MGECFYAVQHVINGHSGIRPSTFSTKEEAINFAIVLDNLDTDGVITETHVYEVQY